MVVELLEIESVGERESVREREGEFSFFFGASASGISAVLESPETN